MPLMSQMFIILFKKLKFAEIAKILEELQQIEQTSQICFQYQQYL